MPSALLPGEAEQTGLSNEGSGVSRAEVLCEAVDNLTAAVMAVRVRVAVVTVAICLVLGRLTLWTPLADAPRLLLTSAAVSSVLGQP